MNDTDIILLNRWRGAGDAEAFSGLVARHADMVYAVCRRITGSATEAEDVAQECFLRLAQCKDSIRSSVAGWLHGLAVWRSLDWLRAEGRRRRLEHTYADSARSPEIAWNDLQPHIDEAIADLPVRTRDLIVRHFLEGETHAQIADSLGLSRSSVTRSINRGIDRVRKTLRRKGVPVEMPALVALIGKHGADVAPTTLKVSLGKLALSGIVPAQPFSLGRLLGIGAGGTRLVAREVLLITFGVLIVLGVTSLVKRFQATGSSHPAPVVASAAPSAVAAKETSSAPPPTASVARQEQPSVSAAAAPDKTAKDLTQKTSSVSGRVRDLFGANPIAGVHVQVSAKKEVYDFSPKLYFADSDANGDYAVTGLDIIGPIEITASATGYGNQYKEITLKAGDALKNVDIEIYKGFDYVGQVLSSSGAPVAGAVVAPQRMRTPLIVTDKDGLFRFASNYEDESPAVEIIAKGYGAALFTNVAFKPGETIPFRLSSPASIYGRLTWSDGSPAAECLIHARPITDEEIEMEKKGLATQGFSRVFAGSTGADGRYDIDNLAPGLRYSVWFSLADGHTLGSHKGAVGPLPSGGVYEFNHVLTKPATVSGTITVSNSDVVLKSAYVRALREGPDSVSSVDLRANDGKYVLNIAEPGTYLISADYGYPQHLHETDSEVKMYEKRLEVKEGDTLNLDLEAPPPYVFAVRASDVDGKVVPATQFGLTWPSPDGDARGTSTAVAADSQGRFVWYCKPGRELWITANADGYIQASTEHVTTKAGVVAPERMLVLYRAGSLKANLIESDDVEHGVHLRVTYPDGVVADMPTTNYGGGSYGVVNAVRAGRMSVIAIEEKTDTPHRSQPVECTVAPGEVYDLGDMVVE